MKAAPIRIMNIKEITIKYLKENGFDGLQNSDMCGCKIDNLMPCESLSEDCEPGYIKDCSTCDHKYDNDEYFEDYDFCIGSIK